MLDGSVLAGHPSIERVLLALLDEELRAQTICPTFVVRCASRSAKYFGRCPHVEVSTGTVEEEVSTGTNVLFFKRELLEQSKN